MVNELGCSTNWMIDTVTGLVRNCKNWLHKHLQISQKVSSFSLGKALLWYVQLDTISFIIIFDFFSF